MPDQMGLTDGKQHIQLKTEPDHRIAGFLVGNSLCLGCGLPPKPYGCDCEKPHRIPVVGVDARDSKRGKALAICGAGPSLKAEAYRLREHKGDVWGANTALNYLVEQELPVTHGIAIDPSDRMFGKVWPDPPDVPYYLATTVNPGLTGHLLGHGRSVTQFHSLRGAPDEFNLYQLLYDWTPVCSNGLNVINRALDLAGFLGYSKIRLYGCDHSLAADDVMYADGREVEEPQHVLTGTVDGREWRTLPDMLLAATALVRVRNKLGRMRVSFVGDVLPYALQNKPEAFLRSCIDWKARA